MVWSDGAVSVNERRNRAVSLPLVTPRDPPPVRSRIRPGQLFRVVVTDAMGLHHDGRGYHHGTQLLLTASTSATQSTCGNGWKRERFAAGGSGYTYLRQPGIVHKPLPATFSRRIYRDHDANGLYDPPPLPPCSDMGAPVIQPGPIIPVNCPAVAMVPSVTLTGGTAPFQYPNGPGGVSSGNAVSGLECRFLFTCWTDGNQCVAVQSLSSQSRLRSNLSSMALPVSCHGGNDDWNRPPPEGFPGYTNLWSNGTTASTASMLSPPEITERCR